jgi:hypothetical protein
MTVESSFPLTSHFPPYVQIKIQIIFSIDEGMYLLQVQKIS